MNLVKPEGQPATWFNGSTRSPEVQLREIVESYFEDIEEVDGSHPDVQTHAICGSYLQLHSLALEFVAEMITYASIDQTLIMRKWPTIIDTGKGFMISARYGIKTELADKVGVANAGKPPTYCVWLVEGLKKDLEDGLELTCMYAPEFEDVDLTLHSLDEALKKIR